MSGEQAAGGTQRWTAKGRATRARIVERAAELMYRQGVTATSTEEILAAAEVSNSQLYHYFADKQDLTRAVIAHQIEAVLRPQETMLDGLDSFAALERWRDDVVAFAAQPEHQRGCPIGSLASELANLDEAARVDLAAGLERWETAIRLGLDAMRDRGDLRPNADPEHLALATLAALQGGLLLVQTSQDTTPLRAGLDAALGYIRTFAADGPG